MRRSIPAWALSGLTLLWLRPGAGLADDWLVLNPLQIELLAQYDSRRYDTGSYEEFTSIFQGGLGLTQDGYSFDPGIFRFSVRLEPLYTRVARDVSIDNEDQNFSADEVLTNYDINFHLLGDTTLPVRAEANLMKEYSFNSLALGSTTLAEVERNQAAVYWKDYFPSRLSYEERDFRQTFRSGLSDQQTKRDETAKSLQFEGRSTHMWLFAEALDQDDRVFDRDFQRTRMDWRHRLPWGSGSSLVSEVHYQDRSGFNAFEQIQLRERATIRHLESLYSDLALGYSATTRTTKADALSGDYQLTHSLYQNIYTTFSAQGSSAINDGFDQDDWRSGLEVRYRKPQLFGVDVNLGLGGFLGNVDRVGKEGVIEVVDEPHVVPLAGDVLLNRRFVILSTVVVTDDSGTLVYDEGFDYELRSLSEGFTQLQVIPGGRIQTGDQLLISYDAEALPSSEYDFRERDIDFSLAWRGFSLSYNDTNRNNTLVSGSDTGFLQDYKNTTVRLGYRHVFTRADISLDFERRESETGQFYSLTHTADQALSYTLSPQTRIDLRLTESSSEQDGGTNDLYQVQLSLLWRPGLGLSVQPLLSAWKRRYDNTPGQPDTEQEEQYLTAGFRLQWSFRKIWVDFSLYHNEREVSSTSSTDDRVMLRLTRRFR